MLKVSVDTVVSRRRAMGVNFRERRKGTTSYYYCARSKRPCPKGGLPSSIAQRFDVSLATVYRIRRESLPVLEVHKRNKPRTTPKMPATAVAFRGQRARGLAGSDGVIQNLTPNDTKPERRSLASC